MKKSKLNKVLPFFVLPVNCYFKFKDGPGESIYKKLSVKEYAPIDGLERKSIFPALTIEIIQILDTPIIEPIGINENELKVPFFTIPIGQKFRFAGTDTIYTRINGKQYTSPLFLYKGQPIEYTMYCIDRGIIHVID